MTTNAATHTPGPWYVEGANPPIVFANNGLDIVAQCDSGGEGGTQTELADAMLAAREKGNA